MPQKSSPSDPAAFQLWLDELEQQWLAGLVPDPRAAAIIVTNPRGEVLLQLRDNNPLISFPNSWSLPGGVVEPNETPVEAAQRELKEETSLQLSLSFWKMYKRKSARRAVTIEEHVYLAHTDLELAAMSFNEGQDWQYFLPAQFSQLSIAFGFDKLLEEYFANKASAG